MSVAPLIERVNVVLLRHRAAVQRVATASATAGLSAAAGARHAGRNVGQAAAKVGTDVVVNERIRARVAVRETVTEDAENGVDAVLRLQSEVRDEQVRVHRQPTGAEYHDDCQEHAPRVRRTASLLTMQSAAAAPVFARL